MKTALTRRLTPEQLEKLTTAAVTRLKEIRGTKEYTGWSHNRERYEQISAGNLSYRLEAANYSGQRNNDGKTVPTIFDALNESLNIVQSVRRFLVARVTKDLFGSVPFFYAKPEGPIDDELSLKLQKHADWKLRLADYREKMKEAVGIALDMGECPVKTTWDKRVDISERLATLLTDKTTGQPVLTADGDHLEDTDETTGGDPATDAQGMPVLGQDGQPQTNPISFVKAPEIQIDPAIHTFAEHLVEETTVIYQGLRIDAVHWKDVVWPINASSLADADFVAHTFDMRWSALRAKYAPNSFKQAQQPDNAIDPGEDEENAEMENLAHSTGETIPGIGQDDIGDTDAVDEFGDADVMAILTPLKGESRGPKSYESQPTRAEGEVQGGEVEDPMIKVCEVSYDFDCFEDGILRRLWLVLLPDHDACLYADFRANISPRAAKPIHLVVVNKVKHRAYGKGLHETYERMATMADRLLCGILWRNAMISNPAKFFDGEKTKEFKGGKPLVLAPNATITPDGQQFTVKDILQYVEMPDLDERTWKLMELFMQIIQVDSGVTNANQGDMTDLPSNTTATGVNSMLESSSVLHQYVLEEIRDSLTPHLCYAIELLYMMQDTSETYGYLSQDDATPGADGQASSQVISEVMALTDAKKLSKLAMQIEFLLTRAKRQEERESALAGIPQAVAWGNLPPAEQARMIPIFVQLFRALGFENPEKFFPMPDLNTPPPKPPMPHASEAIAGKMESLAPNQQDAFAQQLGLPPAQWPQGQPPVPGQPPPDGGAGAPVNPPSGPTPSLPPSAAPTPSNVTTDPGEAAPDDTGAPINDRSTFQDPTDASAGAQPAGQ